MDTKFKISDYSLSCPINDRNTIVLHDAKTGNEIGYKTYRTNYIERIIKGRLSTVPRNGTGDFFIHENPHVILAGKIYNHNSIRLNREKIRELEGVDLYCKRVVEELFEYESEGYIKKLAPLTKRYLKKILNCLPK